VQLSTRTPLVQLRPRAPTRCFSLWLNLTLLFFAWSALESFGDVMSAGDGCVRLVGGVPPRGFCSPRGGGEDSGLGAFSDC
jgi:hypothetical protein